jgi:dienelactone hydrolase
MTNQSPICADCITGSIHEGTPKGRTATLHGLDTYIAEPPDGRPPKGLVVMISDAFGWELTNSRVLADVYAEKGSLLVYLPDFYASQFVFPLFSQFISKTKW